MKTNIKLLTAGSMLCLLQLLTMPVTYAVIPTAVAEIPSGVSYDELKIIQSAPDEDTSGWCIGRDDSIHWSYSSKDKVLQIWGQGVATWYLDYIMNGTSGLDISGYSLLPWQAVRNYVKVAIVHEGITCFGCWIFKDFTNLVKVILPNSLKYNFAEIAMCCHNLKELHFGAGAEILPAGLFVDNSVDMLFLKTIPRACCQGELSGSVSAYDNTNYIFSAFGESERQITTIVPLDKLEEARASVVLQHPNNTIISEYDYYAAGGGVYDTEYIPVTVYDTTRVPVTVNDTTHVEHIDTTYSYARIYLADTVWTTEYKTEYNIIFVPLEIKTGIYPYPEETKTPFLYRLTPTTFQSSSPYDKETLYFYNISGELTDKVTYTGGGTVQTSRPLYHTIIAVSDRGWYQVIR